MLTSEKIFKLQSENPVEKDGVHLIEDLVSYESYLAECRLFHQRQKVDNYVELSKDVKQDLLKKDINIFVKDNPLKVRGYIDSRGIVNQEKLITDLIDSITGYAVLKPALYDSNVDEIQINDYLTLFVVKGGVTEYYTDENGHPCQFSSPEEVETVLNKLIDGGTGEAPVLASGNPLLNAKTHEHHYRVNAIHSSVTTRAKAPYDFAITSFTIRKFKETHLTLDQIIETGTCTPQMGKLIQLLGRADVKLFCVGATASGKTTFLNTICHNIPAGSDTRIILAQNPTEISFFERDEYGRLVRNVLHWEVTPEAPLPSLVSNTLRQTPDIIIIGEMRDGDEFKEAIRASKTGHRVLASMHSEDEKDAIERIGEEINTGSLYEALKRASSCVDVILVMKKFGSGARKLMAIAEIQGVSQDCEVQSSRLFEYRLTGKIIENPRNGMPEPEGYFAQVNPISKKLQEKFFSAGIPLEEIKEFIDFEVQEVA